MPLIFHKDFIDIKGIAVPVVLSLQSASVKGAELDTSKPDGLMADGGTSFSEQIFNILVVEVELVVEPNGIGDDIRRESMSLSGIHPAIPAIPAISVS